MDSAQFRSHFPIFEHKVHLCSCSEGALSDRVSAAMDDFLRSWRERGAPWETWMGQVGLARGRFADLIGAAPADIAAVSCASEGAFHIASTLPLEGSRQRILTTDLEFPSIAHVWLAQRPRGADVRHIPLRGALVEDEDILKAIDERTVLVSVPLAAYANGQRFNLTAIIERAHAVGARVFVDAYQGLGVVPFDVQSSGADYVVAGTLKYLLGAPGLSFLYVRPELVPEHEPVLTGWFGRENPFAFNPRLLDFAPDARRFQTGTPAIPAAYAGAAGLSLILETERDTVFRHIQDLSADLSERFTKAGIALNSPLDAPRRGPQVTVRCERAGELAEHLEQAGVIASPRGDAVRLSLHYYNNREDIDRAESAVRAFLG